VQDRDGKTIFQADSRQCNACDATVWSNQAEPTVTDDRDQVLDPMTAYQITSMMEGVVQRGTATVVKAVGKPIAGKTGTTKNTTMLGLSASHRTSSSASTRIRQAPLARHRQYRRRHRRSDLH